MTDQYNRARKNKLDIPIDDVPWTELPAHFLPGESLGKCQCPGSQMAKVVGRWWLTADEWLIAWRQRSSQQDFVICEILMSD
jgi:hypothetical protein